MATIRSARPCIWVIALWGCARAAPEAHAPTHSAETPPAPEPRVETSPPKASEPVVDPPAPKTEREIAYISGPQGLRVEVEGATFVPRAKPVRVGDGWAVRVEVEVTVEGTVLSLLEPAGGPLAFAGALQRGEHATRFTDQRVGDGERFLTPADPVVLRRDFPDGPGEKPLGRGDRLRLEVGLWGLGADADSRRPVKRLFQIDMVVGAKTPQPVVGPPRTADFPGP